MNLLKKRFQRGDSMLGVSVFLGEDLAKETTDYLRSMKNSGFKGVFSSLHIPEDDSTKYLERLTTLGNWSKNLGMALMVDISGSALNKIGLSFEDPAAIISTGITGLRMDYGISNQVIADLSHSMKISLNASTITDTDVAELRIAKADFQNLEAWHNYYPRPETGLAKTVLIAKNRWLKQLGFRVMAFVTGNASLRGPLFESLPTLEKHRHMHPLAATIELLEDCLVDDVYIGDPEIDYKTQRQFEAYFNEDRLVLFATPEKQSAYSQIVLGNHQNRWDPARDVVRSAAARFKQIGIIQPEGEKPRPKGSVTLDNQLYGRYAGEIQITLHHLPADKKVNVVAQIIPEDIPLLDWFAAGQQFEIQLNKGLKRGVYENEFR